MEIHARIQNFLQQHSVVSLVSGAPAAEQYTKAGIVPFMRDPYRYYLMKPAARHQDLSPPEFQLCKGTRMHRLPDGNWRDMHTGEARGHHQETLVQTALREGIEELGIRLENIQLLFELGSYDFASARTGKSKQMWLFAAEMLSEDDFLPPHQIEASTAHRGWHSAHEFAVAGRADHKYILPDIETRLIAHYGR